MASYVEPTPFSYFRQSMTVVGAGLVVTGGLFLAATLRSTSGSLSFSVDLEDQLKLRARCEAPSIESNDLYCVTVRLPAGADTPVTTTVPTP